MFYPFQFDDPICYTVETQLKDSLRKVLGEEGWTFGPAGRLTFAALDSFKAYAQENDELSMCRFVLFYLKLHYITLGREMRSTAVLDITPSIFIIGGLWCQKQVSKAMISTYILHFTAGCNHLFLPEIPASVAQVII